MVWMRGLQTNKTMKFRLPPTRRYELKIEIASINSAILIFKILKSIWETFGSNQSMQLRGYTHDECLEWKIPPRVLYAYFV